MGSGTVQLHLETALDALLKLRKATVFWPGEEERDIIALRIEQQWHFINCVGIIDGTLFPSEFRPTLDGEDCFTRKGGHAVHSLPVCDDTARIRGLTMGWAGSVHDNRAWTRCKCNNSRDTFFRSNEHLLGDSAFEPSNVMVPAFKKPFRGNLDECKSFFDTKPAKPRVKSEHCIGLLKGRFQILKRIWVVISCKKDMIRVNRTIMASVILHNLMIQEPFPEDWMHKEDSSDSEEEEESDEVQSACENSNKPIDPNNNSKRRESLHHCLTLKLR